MCHNREMYVKIIQYFLTPHPVDTKIYGKDFL